MCVECVRVRRCGPPHAAMGGPSPACSSTKVRLLPGAAIVRCHVLDCSYCCLFVLVCCCACLSFQFNDLPRSLAGSFVSLPAALGRYAWHAVDGTRCSAPALVLCCCYCSPCHAGANVSWPGVAWSPNACNPKFTGSEACHVMKAHVAGGVQLFWARAVIAKHKHSTDYLVFNVHPSHHCSSGQAECAWRAPYQPSTVLSFDAVRVALVVKHSHSLCPGVHPSPCISQAWHFLTGYTACRPLVSVISTMFKENRKATHVSKHA